MKMYTDAMKRLVATPACTMGPVRLDSEILGAQGGQHVPKSVVEITVLASCWVCDRMSRTRTHIGVLPAHFEPDKESMTKPAVSSISIRACGAWRRRAGDAFELACPL